MNVTRSQTSKDTFSLDGAHYYGLIMVSNPSVPGGLVHPYQLDESIFRFRVSDVHNFEWKFLYANSVDSDQTPFAASDLGLHCLPMSQKWDVRHERVK